MDGAGNDIQLCDRPPHEDVRQMNINHPVMADRVRTRQLTGMTFRSLFAICLAAAIAFFMILAICLILHARGKMNLHDNDSDPVVVAAPRENVGMAAYELYHLDDPADPFANAPGWFVIPIPPAMWMDDFQNSASTHPIQSDIENAQARILKCANALLQLDSKGIDMGELNATYTALLECKQVIERRLADLMKEHRLYWKSEYTHHPEIRPRKRAVNREEQSWLDEVKDCEQTYCTGFNGTHANCDSSDFLGGFKGPWQNCHLCHPKTADETTEFQEKIREHCTKMVANQWRAFYLLCGLLLLSLSVAFVGILARNRKMSQEHQARENRRQAWIDSRRNTRTAARGTASVSSKILDRQAIGKREDNHGSVDVEGGRKANRFHSKWYSIFGKRTSDRREQGDRIDMAALRLDGPGAPISTNLVPVMPPAPNAKGRTSSFDRVEPCPGLRPRAPLDGASDVQRPDASSNPGRVKNGSLDDSLPVTNKVFKHGLGGRLCSSNATDQSTGG